MSLPPVLDPEQKKLAIYVTPFHYLQRRQPTDYTLSHAKALKKTRFESVKTTIRERRLFFAGAVARQNERRLPIRVMLGKMTGGEGQRPSGYPKSWHRCLLDDLKAFDDTEGSTEHSKLFLGWTPRCGQLQIRRTSGIAGSSKQQNAS